ncbi:MAG: hypothetical protein E5299_01405 [Burkholderia gladioli]|nr:MAG: hypothetical protein E5299_01405 [Burkholderia gladioli]
MRTQRNGLRTSLVRNPFISPEIIDPKFVINMPVDAIAYSHLIYATTPLPILRDNEPIHLVVGSTGLKVHGEDAWKGVRQHGYSKRHTWRIVHFALNATNQ